MDSTLQHSNALITSTPIFSGLPQCSTIQYAGVFPSTIAVSKSTPNLAKLIIAFTLLQRPISQHKSLIVVTLLPLISFSQKS